MKTGKRSKFAENNSGVTEIVGTILLLAITVIMFAGFMIYLFSMASNPPEKASTHLEGTTDGVSQVYVKHMGGLPLGMDTIVVHMSINGVSSIYKLSEVLISDPSHWSIVGGNGASDELFNIGEKIVYTDIAIKNGNISLMVVSTRYNAVLFFGVIQGEYAAPAPPPSGTWITTTEADFESGVPASVDTNSSSGDVKLTATSTPYNPSGYNLLGSTAFVSGTTGDLTSNNDVYMTFESYASSSEYLQVTYQSAGSGSGTTGNPTPSYPSGLQANDLILL